MARSTSPDCKQCRREGCKLFLKGERCLTKCSFDKRPTVPGQHGAGRKKFSEYGGPGLMLLFTRTDIKAWHEYIFPSAKYIFFIKGRLKFCRPDGSQEATANAASCLLAWDKSELPLLLQLEKEGLGKLAMFI